VILPLYIEDYQVAESLSKPNSTTRNWEGIYQKVMVLHELFTTSLDR